MVSRESRSRVRSFVVVAFVALSVLAAGLVGSAFGARAGARAIVIPGAAATLPAADFPNDPGFAGCEARDPNDECAGDDDWYLYGALTGDTCRAPGSAVADQPHPDGGLPCWAIGAKDPQHAAGVNVTGAWAQGNVGRDDVLIAYIEGGVNYENDGLKDALDNIYLNPGELPYPQDPSGQDKGTLDYDGNGRFDIRDYVDDPRVNPACAAGTAPFKAFEEGTTRSCLAGGQHPYLHDVQIGGKETKYLTPEDLIAVFGHCQVTDHRLGPCTTGGRFDNDQNGYPNDISGWNTYRNNNDAQTEDPGYGHPSGGFRNTVAVANNGYGSAGNCRNCRIVPVKQGAECLGLSDKWAAAMLYATNLGADVISSVVVSYQYSSYGRAAVEYANRKGVLLSLDSNDFDSTDHTDGMMYPHAIPGNSVVADTKPGTKTQWFRARSNITSYGPHNVFSGMETTTSGATPFMAGLLGMVQSAARNARDAGEIPRDYTPNEVRQVLMNTASAVVPQTQAPSVPKQWPGNPGSKTDDTHTSWSTQYGYGRIDLGAATALVKTGLVPPSTEFSSPDWYAYVDPSKQRQVPIKGYVNASAWKSQGVSWALEWALGADPKDTDFHTISQGSESRNGLLGTLTMNDVLRKYAQRGVGGTGITNTPLGPERYTVTLRIRAVDGGLKGEDRRTITVREDPQLVRAPRKVGGEPAAGSSYVDLEGRYEQDLVVGNADGRVDAFRPNGHSIPGFPVRTKRLSEVDPNNPEGGGGTSYKEVAALRDARDPVGGTAVGDLDGDGKLEVVASTASGSIYAWSSSGRLLKGFPVATDTKYWSLPVPTPMTTVDGSRLPARGGWSPPVLVDLRGDGRLSILESSFDGQLYAWDRRGRTVPGWPVTVAPPASLVKNRDKLISDPKLVYSAGVGDVLGTGKPQVFVSGFDCDDDANHVFVYGIWPDGTKHKGGPYLKGWPAVLTSLTGCYDQSIDFVEEGASPPMVAPVRGKPRVIASAVGGTPAVISPQGKVERTMNAACTGQACAGTKPYMQADGFNAVITGQGGAGDLNGDGTPEIVQSVVGAPSTLNAVAGSNAGQAQLNQSYEKAWHPGSGETVGGFPQRQDGFAFFTAPAIAGLGKGKTRAAVESNDSHWIHAYQPSGKEAPGFPKFVGQWPSFSGVIGSPRFDGTLRMAHGTREGYLFEWDVQGSPARNDQWWHYRHDEHNSGQWGLDTRRPAIVTAVTTKRVAGGVRVRFRAPGNDGIVGRAARYQAWILSPGGKRRSLHAPKPKTAGTMQEIRVPVTGRSRTVVLAIRAVDRAGNIGAERRVTVRGAARRAGLGVSFRSAPAPAAVAG